MKALILCAGLGARLSPITDLIPKPLVPIGGKPLLGHWFSLLNTPEIDEIYINAFYLPEQITSFVENNKKKYQMILHVIIEPNLQGTAGTLLNLKNKFNNAPFLVAHGDNLTNFVMKDFMLAHMSRPSNCCITMMTFTTDTPSSCGIVEVDKKGIVLNLYEKVSNPPGNLANAAVYIMEPEVFDDLPQNILDISLDILPKFVGRINTFHNSLYHRDIGTLSSYNQAQQDFLDKKFIFY